MAWRLDIKISCLYGYLGLPIEQEDKIIKAKKLVKKWYGLQKENILKAWEHIQNDEVFEKVPPLN